MYFSVTGQGAVRYVAECSVTGQGAIHFVAGFSLTEHMQYNV